MSRHGSSSPDSIPPLPLSRHAKSSILFKTIGWPIGTGPYTPTPDEVESVAHYAFKSRVGLLFLEECIQKRVPLSPDASALHTSLQRRRVATDAVVAKLARALDSVAQGEWTTFKSFRPILSTPNDTDWFPFSRDRHRALCEHLLADGAFSLLETAPLQTTLVESSGTGLVDSTKRGGVFYIDCYVIPSTDYFVYLDPERLRGDVDHVEIAGYPVPVLQAPAELAATLFHNVFPERTYSHESYYLIKTYVDQIFARSTEGRFVEICRDQKIEYPAAWNLALTRQVDASEFGITDERLGILMDALGYPELGARRSPGTGPLPLHFPRSVFWWSFLSKQRDQVSRRSTYVQLAHMLNPVFLVDVLRILWKRTVRGSVYEQN